jgi:glycosyltransferase involved in cell wall biosynthesis
LEKSLKVSVCVITYNQEKYIRQCLQSIIDQVTDFNFEIIVGEDCSTDGTKKIVEEFAERYPEKIKPIYQKENIGGGSNNFLTVHRAAAGEYIAHVDGDDYCLPGKLQTQANLLDADPNCNIVFHRMFLMKHDGEVMEPSSLNFRRIEEKRFYRADILQYIAIGGHSSKMYRKKFRDYELPKSEITDYHANVEQISDGYARYAGRECLGVYRMGAGIASGGIRPRRALANSFIFFCKKYPRYRLQINTAALMYLVMDLKNYRKTWALFFRVWVQTFHICSIIHLWSSRDVLRQLR